jgi:hypothetical protein
LTATQISAVVKSVEEELSKENGPDLFKLDTLMTELKLDKDARVKVTTYLENLLRTQLSRAVSQIPDPKINQNIK